MRPILESMKQFGLNYQALAQDAAQAEPSSAQGK
jgi:hypothetical protein